VNTAAHGRFDVRLSAGSYTIRASNTTGAVVPTAGPVTVAVIAGRITDITIRFDSGIR
jgi:hypothetical protein